MPTPETKKKPLTPLKRKQAFIERLWTLVDHYLDQLETCLRDAPTLSGSSTGLARDIGALVTTLDRLCQLDLAQSEEDNTQGDNMSREPNKKRQGRTAPAPDPNVIREQLLEKLEQWATAAKRTGNTHNPLLTELAQCSDQAGADQTSA
jgi:hypothetical protein